MLRLLTAFVALLVAAALAPAFAADPAPSLPGADKPSAARPSQPRSGDRNLLDRLGLGPGKPRRADEPAINAVPKTPAEPVVPGFAQADRNGDGFVSRNEFMTERAQVAVPTAKNRERMRRYNARLERRFGAADADRDGRLTPREIDRAGGRFF